VSYDNGKLGLQRLRYPASIPPKPRPILKTYPAYPASTPPILIKTYPAYRAYLKKIPRRVVQIKSCALFAAANMLNPSLV